MNSESLTWLIPLGVSIVGGIITYASTMSAMKQRIISLEDDMKDSKSQTRDLRDRTIKCETILNERGPVVQSHSPLSLTERGKRLLEESGGKTYIDSKKDELIGAITQKQPKSAYDVQELANQVVRDRTNLEDFVPLKNYLFAQGEPLDNLVAVMGIELRDIALPKLGFDMSDLDKMHGRK